MASPEEFIEEINNVFNTDFPMPKKEINEKLKIKEITEEEETCTNRRVEFYINRTLIGTYDIDEECIGFSVHRLYEDEVWKLLNDK